MSHLSTERLAALVDEPATAEELAHLASCAPCAGERAAYDRLAELSAAESARIGAPISRWEALRPALAAHGLIDAAVPDAGAAMPMSPVRAYSPNRRRLQAAAAVLLVAGGVVGGRYSAGAALLPMLPTGVVAHVGQDSAGAADSTPRFASIEEARAAQERAQVVYQTATAFLAERDTGAGAAESAASMRARLAALDRAREVMGEALNEAPYDPVINGYYLTTLGQREATLRQINTAMPASMRIKSY
jgi:hypothetical protein